MQNLKHECNRDTHFNAPFSSQPYLVLRKNNCGGISVSVTNTQTKKTTKKPPQNQPTKQATKEATRKTEEDCSAQQF